MISAARSLSWLAFLLVVATIAGSSPVATIGDAVVTLDAVDARCGAPCAALLSEIAEGRAAMLETLIDEALLAGVAIEARAVAESEVDAYLVAHAAEFHGPPARDRAAARFYLEREARRRSEADQLAIERARRPPSRAAGAGAAGSSDAQDVVLAEAGRRVIRTADVEARLALPLYRLGGALQRERRRHLDTLIAEALLGREAATRGMTVAELRAATRREVPPIVDADVDRYFEQEVRRHDPRAVKRPDRLRPYLEFRAAQAAEDALLARLRAATPVSVTLPAVDPPRLRLGPGRTGWRGNPEAPVAIVFLTSYRGATSRAMWEVVRELASVSGTSLAVRPLLPQWDPEATAVAAAVRCAVAGARQWDVHDAVASANPLPDRETLDRIAAAAGLTPHEFAACMAQPSTTAGVTSESLEAERLGLEEPPAVLINGLAFSGMQDVARLRNVVREEHLRGKTLTPPP